MSGQQEPPLGESADWFVTTHWSVVRHAGDPTTTVALDALEKLCTAYWFPLYAYVRRKGNDEHEAQDLTQEFFARLLARNDFAGLDPGSDALRRHLLELERRGRRSHFLRRRRTRAQIDGLDHRSTLPPRSSLLS